MERSSQGQVRCVRKAVRWYRMMSWCLEAVPNCFAVCFCLPFHPFHLPSPHTSLTLLNSFHITPQSFHYPHNPSTIPTLLLHLPHSLNFSPHLLNSSPNSLNSSLHSSPLSQNSSPHSPFTSPHNPSPPSHTPPDGGKVEVWSLKSRQLLQTIRGPAKGVTCLVLRNDHLFCGDVAGMVHVWRLDHPPSPAMEEDDTVWVVSEVKVPDAVPFRARCIRCLCVHGGVVYWGDDGTNIKALDISNGLLFFFVVFLLALSSTTLSSNHFSPWNLSIPFPHTLLILLSSILIPSLPPLSSPAHLPTSLHLPLPPLLPPLLPPHTFPYLISSLITPSPTSSPPSSHLPLHPLLFSLLIPSLPHQVPCAH